MLQQPELFALDFPRRPIPERVINGLPEETHGWFISNLRENNWVMTPRIAGDFLLDFVRKYITPLDCIKALVPHAEFASWFPRHDDWADARQQVNDADDPSADVEYFRFCYSSYYYARQAFLSEEMMKQRMSMRVYQDRMWMEFRRAVIPPRAILTTPGQTVDATVVAQTQALLELDKVREYDSDCRGDPVDYVGP